MGDLDAELGQPADRRGAEAGDVVGGHQRGDADAEGPGAIALDLQPAVGVSAPP
ncbi:MAG: hypothetical protein U0599_16775 [Vicinamibacteria bacterium]